MAETPPEEVRPPRLVTGDDLKELGIHARARDSRRSCDAVEEASSNGSIRTREEALEFVQAKLSIAKADDRSRLG